jgi:hypothetical protein
MILFKTTAEKTSNPTQYNNSLTSVFICMVIKTLLLFCGVTSYSIHVSCTTVPKTRALMKSEERYIRKEQHLLHGTAPHVPACRACGTLEPHGVLLLEQTYNLLDQELNPFHAQFLYCFHYFMKQGIFTFLCLFICLEVDKL